jgi:transposase-like protein
MRRSTTMVEGQSMTVADVVAGVRDGRLEDFVREAVVLIARELMETEITGEIGAELGEVAPEKRSTHRNGYRPRGWETRVGELELLIPKKRQGPAYFPSFLEPRRRSEQAIVAVVMESYVIHEGPAGVKGRWVRGLWWSGAGSRTAVWRGRRLQSSIRSR